MISELLASRFLPKQIAQLAQRATGLGSTATALVEPESTEMTRAGRRFSAIGLAAGAAPVQAIPTTAAAHLLYNADASRAYIIDAVSVYLLSGTATAGLALLGIVTKPTSTLPTAAAGSLVSSLSNGGLSSKAIIASGYTIPAPAGSSQWSVLGASSGGVPGVGGGFSQDLKGRIIVPPGQCLGLTVLAGAGTSPLYVPGFTWTEAELDLE